MRQIILAIVCLLITINGQPTEIDWIGDANGGDWETATLWSTNVVPSKQTDYAYFKDPSAGTITCKLVKDIYGVDFYPADGGMLDISNNFTAHVIDVRNGQITADKGSWLMPHNASSVLTVYSDKSTLDVKGMVDIPVVQQAGNVKVEQGASVSMITASGGNITVWGTVKSIVLSSSGVYIQVYGSVGSITTDDYRPTVDIYGTGSVDSIIAYDATVTVHKGGVLKMIDPYGGQLHLLPGSKCDTIDFQHNYGGDVYFDSGDNATENQIDVQTVKSVYGGNFWIANNTHANIHSFWNTSTSSNAYFYGWAGSELHFLKGCEAHWYYVILKQAVTVVVDAEAMLTITGSPSSSAISVSDTSTFINRGTINADNGISVSISAIDTWATFTNDKTGMITSSMDAGCYFSGTYVSIPGGYQYSMMTNWGVISCVHAQFYQINVDNYATVTSDNIELPNYYSDTDKATFTYKEGSDLNSTISWKGRGGSCIIEGNREITDLQIDSSSSYYVEFRGNTTIYNFNGNGSCTVYWYGQSDSWISFNGRVDARGTFYYQNATVMYSGVYYEHQGPDYYLSYSTVTFTDKCTTKDDGDSYTTYWYINEASALYFAGITHIYSLQIRFLDANGRWFNQGVTTLDSSIYINTYDDTTGNRGYAINVGKLRVNGGTFYSVYGNCGGNLILVDDNTDYAFSPYINIYREWAMAGSSKIQLEVPVGFDRTVWDQSDQEIISYNTDYEPESWDVTDEKNAEWRIPDSINPLDNTFTPIFLCKSSGYVYAYLNTKPSSCGTATIAAPSEICSIPGIPPATDPTGGEPTSPTNPTTVPVGPSTPAAPVPVGPTTPVAPVPVGPTTPVAPVPVGPTTPVAPVPVGPTTPGKGPTVAPGKAPAPAVAPSSAGTFSFSVLVTLILSFYLFIMF